jgi:DHA2 family methylenomycin A resistance protein-like MFS transporter
MGGLTYGVIEGGAAGFTSPHVVVSLALGDAAGVAFLVTEVSAAHPMVPLGLFRARNVSIAVGVGFAFVVGYYGLPFVMSLYLQQERGLSSLAAGLVFLPMMLSGATLTPFSARLTERAGARTVVAGGLVLMTLGLVVLAATPAMTQVWVLAGLMTLVGMAGPFVIPPVTAVLLNSVPDHLAGTASGVFNTSRQLGGALAIAVFGALVGSGTFLHGLRISLILAAGVAVATAVSSLRLRPAAGLSSAAFIEGA